MTCCGQKRNALKQSQPGTSFTSPGGAASRPVAGARQSPPPSSAALVAYLARKALGQRR